MLKTSLTPEESAKLIELGVSPERASEICMNFNGRYAYVHGEEAQTVRDCVNGHFYVEECRIFTLTDIINILSKEIDYNGLTYELNMWVDGAIWYVEYVAEQFDVLNDDNFESPELIDALYSLLLWCLEKGYVKL